MPFNVNGTTVITNDGIVQLTSGVTGSRPANPVTGQLFFDTTLNKLIAWSGNDWRLPTILNLTIPPSLRVWGQNNFGQLGDNSTTNRSSPVAVVGGFTNWVQIDSGGKHTTAIRADGTAWGWGENNKGQLGDNTIISKLSPVAVVGGFTDWIQISAGGEHTSAIRANGTAWGWGRNYKGQLGDGTDTEDNNRSSPVSVVGGFTDWVQISAGGTHTSAIRANGTAWGWGLATYGRLGSGSASGNYESPVSIEGGFTDWVQISAGFNHSAAIR